ncbi:MAG: replication initiator protein [Microvirus sp.]|nr:MAG: replication initiator protein [Microvirus sp.]
MACYRPTAANQLPDGSIHFKSHTLGGNPISIPCGQCIGCRLGRARDWTARIVNEASLYPSNLFLTLTYDDDHLPANQSLHYPHFQSFMRKLRKWHRSSFFKTNPQAKPEDYIPLRFFMCGEYGEETNRPHYHACVFNLYFDDRAVLKRGANTLYTSPTLSKLWTYGNSSIGQLNTQTARYTARYCLKKVTGAKADDHYRGRTPEFARMSLRPGIGSAWFDRFHSDVYPHGVHTLSGRQGPPPKYYDKLWKRRDSGAMSDLAAERAHEAYKLREDNTPSRRAVKETVKRAQLDQLKRTL